MKEQRRRHRFQTDSKAAAETPPARPTPAPEIPTLKEKEEEKKGAGVPWYAGSGSGAPGLVAGQGVARMGAGAALRGSFLARMAAGLSSALGGNASFLGGLFASALGKWLVLGALMAWGGLMLVAGGKLLGGWGAADAGLPGAPSLSAMGASGIVIDAPKDRSLGYLANANNGEILWDANKPAGAKEAVKDSAAPAEQAAEAPAKPETPAFEMPDVSKIMGGGLNRDGFVKKLTGDVSQLHGGAGGPGTIKDAGGFSLKKSFAPPASSRGKLGAMSRANRALTTSRLSNVRGRASRAAGQLKLAKAMSTSGNNATTLGDARTFSADAFDQGKSIGGDLSSIGGDGIVAPSGGGGTDMTGAPDLPPGQNITPYQSDMDAAKGAGNQAAALKKLGMMMLAIGAMLVALGMALMGNHTTFPIGWALLGAGLALIAMGMMMLAQSASQADQAKDKGKKVDEQYGQKDQGDIVDDCAGQAAGSGTKTQDCQTQKPQVDGRNTVHQDAEAEKNATYQLEGAAK